jgi:D-amino-acid dehydrogenase
MFNPVLQNEDTQMESNKEIIIVGGGIIGLACAHYLIDQQKTVRIIEQDLIGSGASHGNCGLLHFSGIIPLCAPGVVSHEIKRALKGTSPLYIKPRWDLPLIQWLIKFAASCSTDKMQESTIAKNDILRYSLALFEDLFSSVNLNCDFEKKGLLTLFTDPGYFNKYATTNTFLKQYDFNGHSLTADQTRQLEPAVNSAVVGSWLNPNDWHLRPELLVSAWKDHLIEKGLLIEERARLLNFSIEDKTIKSAITTKGTFDADQFILATGAWAADVNRQLNINLPVQPGKGYSITMEKPDRSPAIPCLLYERNMVVTPWGTGFRLGGTMEFSGFNSELNAKRLVRLINGAKEYLNTDIDQPVIEEWTGLRPMTYDDLPIIGYAPGVQNLILATGHGMLGITMATGTGRMVSDLVTGGRPQIDAAPFSPKRFN